MVINFRCSKITSLFLASKYSAISFALASSSVPCSRNSFRVSVSASSSSTSRFSRRLELSKGLRKLCIKIFLAAGEAEQIQSSVLVFLFFMFSLFLNLYSYCQSRVSFGLFGLSGEFSLGDTISFGALYPLGPFDLRGLLPLGALCPS